MILVVESDEKGSTNGKEDIRKTFIRKNTAC